MKRYVGLVLVAAVLWGGWWMVQAHSLRGQIEGWFDARRAEGWTASYDDLAVRGFPSRLDVTLSGVDIRDPDHGTGWQAPFVQILGLTYQREHLILAFADTQRLILPSGPVDIASDGLRASLVTDGDAIERLNIEAETLNIAGGAALAGVLANFHHLTGTDYRLAIAAQAVATTQGGSDGLNLQATLGFDQPWTLDALKGPRPQPRALDLTQAAYSQNGLQLGMAGKVTADAEGRMDGSLTVRAVNWQAMLDQAEQAGTLPQALADTLRDALTLAAGLNGRRDTLDLPLTFTRGAVSFGVLPLGQAPRLSLP
ncbi:DUF2125 domain-containing protein [Sagittula sp. S175]|uniref:DUF2125 domain-containing protein n=1 Tax=Sagittula sp. S175 TaxID=3415129 RepID=UPI003C7B232F